MEYFVTFLWALLDCIFYPTFWGAFLEPKRSKMQLFVAITISTAIATVYCILIPSQLLKWGLSLTLYFIVIRFLFRGPWYQHLFFIILGCVFNILFDLLLTYGVSALLDISYAELAWRKLTYVVTVSIGRLLTILSAWILQRMRNQAQRQMIPGKWLLLAILFPAMSMAIMMLMFYYFRAAPDLSSGMVIFCSILAIANIAIIYLIGDMEKSTIQAQDNALLHQQMDIQTDSILALERSYRRQRKATHEYQNQLQTILDLLDNGNLAEAKSYIGQLQGMQTSRIFAVSSHHPIIDAILNHKYQYAKELGIDFQIHVNDLSVISMDANSLVILLSNLLDNAIEACAQLSDRRTIQCHISATESVFISIRNTSAPVAILGDSIPTTKEPREEHGFGVPHIQLILNQLNAEYTFSYENGWFEFASEIPVAVS